MTRGDVVRRLGTVALATGLASGTPALAQSPANGQSCGGLLCDLGVFGHKTTPPAETPAVQPSVPVAPPAAKAAALPPDAGVPRPRPPHARRRLVKAPVEAPVAKPHVAKSEAPGIRPSGAPVAKASSVIVKPSIVRSSIVKTPSSPAPVARAAPAAIPALTPPPVAPSVAPLPPPPAVATTRAPAPTYQRPLIFQSIDPMLQ